MERQGKCAGVCHPALAVAVITAALASACIAGATPCRWRVTAIRPPRPGEAPFTERDRLLRDPASANDAPGPGRTRAVVRSDSLHHPHIYLEDASTGDVRELLRGSAPRWSPDGKRIACTIWKSRTRPWNLLIVDVATGQQTEPDSMLSPTEYRWSPDGHCLAVSGQLYDRGKAALAWIDLERHRSVVVDTLPVLSDYDFSWSADSRWLAYSRPTRLLPEEDVCEADLWIASEGGAVKCCVLETPNQVERQPKWIGLRTIQIAAQSWNGARLGEPITEVLELANGLSPPGVARVPTHR